MPAAARQRMLITKHLWMLERGLIMALTEIEARLIDGLKIDGVKKGAAMAVFLMLKEDNQRMDMIEYLLSKEKVTDAEALEMANRLAAR